MRSRALAVALLIFSCAGSCTINLDLAADALFPTGTPFVMRGTADLLQSPDGACLIWRGENGITYHLFQSARVTNADFDSVTTPGVTSRIEIATRTDLIVDCRIGTIVEVQNVLEIVS